MFNRLAFSKNLVHHYIAFGSHSKYEIIITLIDTNCLNFEELRWVYLVLAPLMRPFGQVYIPP